MSLFNLSITTETSDMLTSESNLKNPPSQRKTTERPKDLSSPRTHWKRSITF